jgi:uncharacterized protein YukE
VAAAATSRFELPGHGLLAAQVCLGQRMPAGDPAQLRSAARRSGTWAAGLRRVASTLLSCAETSLWTGAAHRAFVEQLHAHAPSMSATADRYEHYASALNAYATVLDETMPLLLATRGRLRQRYDELAGRAQTTAGIDALALSGSQPATDLLPLAGTFKAGYDRWADALDRCILALSQADAADPTRDVHGFAALSHRVVKTAGGIVSPFERAVLHPSLHNISDCLSSLNVGLTVLGLGLLFICPPAGTACLAAATVVAVAQVSVDATRRARGERVSVGSLGMEMAAAIPLGGNALRGLRAADKVTHLVPGGGLMAHEGLGGGHTLAKHVGKSEEYLLNRLATEPELQAASTFYDRQSAETALSAFMDANSAEITRWLASGTRSLALTGWSSQAVGVAILRGAAGPVEAAGIRLILRRSAQMSTGYRIHTAMVEL